MKHAFETLVATPENCQIKRVPRDLLLKHLDKTLATYVRNR
jgi:hypothetical protein